MLPGLRRSPGSMLQAAPIAAEPTNNTYNHLARMLDREPDMRSIDFAKAIRGSLIVSALMILGAAPAMGAIAIDANVSRDSSAQSNNIVAPAFNTTAPNELLLAFISADANTAGMTVTNVTSAGLTWQLVRRANAQLGTAEIWRAFSVAQATNVTVQASLSQSVAASITVLSFTGVDPVTPVGTSVAASASTGAPTASLVTTRDGSWVFGVGTDWDRPVNRTVGSNQVMVHQFLPSVGDTYWVQRQNAPTPTAGTVVVINDTAPTNDRYNLSIVEVIAGSGGGGTPTYTISGSVTPSANGSGSTLTVTQGSTTVASGTANSSGAYSISGLLNGTYTVTPTRSGFTFSPTSRSVTIADANATGVNFTAAGVPTSNYPDLSVIVPPNQISVSGSGASRTFLYTHDTFNGGAGPLQIQPTYNEASGNYQGYQEVLKLQGGQWSVDHTTPVAGAFVFHPVHGHFHFPFASFGLYARNADGSVGAVVALSPKVGFCIANSFIYDPTLPNAGYGTWGSCSDPTSLRGLSIGAVDEYDYRDDGQSIPIPDLPNGTYWLRAIADPEGLLEESNETNNETDLELTINNNTVTVLRTVVPVLPPAPTATVTSPTNLSTVSGVIQLSATTPSSDVSGMRFLVDGLPTDAIVTAPYAMSLNTTTLQNGEHWLAAQALRSSGLDGTSPVIFFTVNNSASGPPTVTISEPEAGETVSAIVNVGAVAAAQTGTPSVQFFADGAPIGSPDATPPFMVQWNTTQLSAGEHILQARATDQLGRVGESQTVPVIVDNSHPPSVISIDATVFRDTQNTMTTPTFSTTTSSDLLVAFVAYDGPTNVAQTATVTGAGLTWTLVKRSNAQLGTSEIWSAKASSVLTNVTVTSQPSRTGFHGSLTVVAFKNASGPGVAGQASAPTGAPDIYLPGIQPGNWVFAVGNDWDGAVARTPVSGQVIVHQRIDTSVGDTFWVQSTAAPSTTSGLVTIHDNAPTNHQWNYAAVEIVANPQ